ncbi:uncharacterized protein LOC113360450 [Papaver somniferum]|uniref:uncharacterized protein LOC113360450 n=1 Tax=Papaver somniferum TaxID=3469 RepID=UPI000E6FF880|nr:uncharacterized protein LOC113360450 [Papaver somniferum]
MGKKQLPATTFDLSKLSNPTVKEGKPAVVIPDDFYNEGCELWKFSLIGRLDLKGITFQDVKNSFEQQWQLEQGRVQFVPMNRGFFIIKLQSHKDKDKLLNVEAWSFYQLKLNLMEWFPGFDADKHKNSHATVWVKFPSFPMEFWIEKTLLALGKTLGTPIVVDQRTLAHEYGHFASVLIDINFAELNTDVIHVTVGGLDFWKNFEIQKKPKLCCKCKLIGHSDSECRKKTKNNANNLQSQISSQCQKPQGNNATNESGNAANGGSEW